jgi:diketogulonate reductase-like aldo/keto reductase
MLQRIIPSSQEKLPAVGIGTWQTFDVSGDVSYPKLQQTLQNMHQAGGRVIDSSPMYGRAEAVVGDLTSASDTREKFFYATKVWTKGRQAGIAQVEASLSKMKRSTLDLMQIHNLVDWRTHLETLKEWQAAGKVRYIGLTHYTDAIHQELAQIISTARVDFVQFNYSILSRNAEKRLLPAAADHGVATLINRPFTEGSLFSRVKGKDLHEWARELDITSWSQFFLKFILSHPAVTCVIPGTSDPSHVADNMKAGQGTPPDKATCEKMAAFVQSL